MNQFKAAGHSRTLIILILALTIFISSGVLFICFLKDEDRPSAEGYNSEWIRHVKSISDVQYTPEEVVETLEQQKTIKTQEMYDAACFYVYHADERVVKQLIANRRFEMDVRLPEDPNARVSAPRCGASGRFLVPLDLGPQILTDIYHRELLRYATVKNADARFVYFLLRSAPDNTPESTHFQRIFHDDIMAYLSIYANYRDWPTLTNEARQCIVDYPCGWRSWESIDEVLKLALQEGAEVAYVLYFERYADNYQSFSGDYLVDAVDKTHRYEFKHIFRGWRSNDVRGTTLIENVTSDTAVIEIPYVEEVFSMLRNGEDILSLVEVLPGNVMRIPLILADTVELEYRVRVSALWWHRYYMTQL